ENKIPFLGICLGMQCAVIEYARNVLGWNDAHTAEIDSETDKPVIHLMHDQHDVTDKGGTMRLGAYRCSLTKGAKVSEVYGREEISERHRHRYEFNNEYLSDFEAAGMIATGMNPDNGLVEIVEIEEHPWIVSV